jgi:hypothetical protein
MKKRDIRPVDERIVRAALRQGGLSEAQLVALTKLKAVGKPAERRPLGVRHATLEILEARGLVRCVESLRYARARFTLTHTGRELLRFRDGAPLAPAPDDTNRKDTTMTTKKTTPTITTAQRAALKAYADAGTTMDRPKGVHHRTPDTLLSLRLLGLTGTGKYRVTAAGKKALATPATETKAETTAAKVKSPARAARTAKKAPAKKTPKRAAAKRPRKAAPKKAAATPTAEA